ncbi:hypothetical protein [Pseudonocardia lacus]|uniref:hypothetical protein n=1 Tax=Pseudonocardia lacus TaxID=2835865 RepID=UPI001BDBB610|nr:hypothetical protein [Pseudonocardia lacus]
MTDRLRDLSQHPLIRRLGVPRIPVLRRYRPGAPLVDGPALVAQVGGGEMVGAAETVLRDAGRHPRGGWRLSSLRQGGLPTDVAETVSWLVHPGSGGITGQVVRVDGQNLQGA